jgi:thiamine-phosphate pyrophosphorylase
MNFRLPPLYPIIDLGGCDRPLETIVSQLAEGGATLVQLRAKKHSSLEFYNQAVKLVRIANPLGLRVIINDRTDIAWMAEADGVHLGQEDLPVNAARQLIGPGKIIGFSTNTLAQARIAQESNCDYVAIGPVFPTQSKDDADPVVDRKQLTEIRRVVQKPLVAIGGITVENAKELFELGIDSVAVIRDLMTAEDLARRVRKYCEVAAQSPRLRTL